MAPTSSTEVGGINPSGNLQPLQTDATGRLLVSPSTIADPSHVIVDSSALPAGASTSALQTSGNASLTSIDTHTTSIDTKTPALGQALAAASVPVVLTAAQLSTLTPLTSVTVTQATGTNLHTVVDSSALPSGAATSALQTSGNASLTSIDSKLTAPLAVTGPLTDTQLRATPVPVSAASLPLPTGAATEATLAAVNAKLPAQGQALMAASQPVTIASDQTPIPVTTSTSDVTASGNITIINSVPAGTATAGSAVLSGTLNGAATGMVQVTGTYTGALSLQFTVNGTVWITAGGTPFLNVATGALSATITSATQGIFQVEITGAQQYRITALAAVTGTATVSLRSSRTTGMVGIDASLPTGTNTIGGVTIASGTVTTVSTVTAVTTVGTITNGVNIAGKAATNVPIRTDYGSTPVTTAAYTQLIASTSGAITKISVFDSSGQAMILATGAAASEVIRLYIPPGGGDYELAIPTATRISIKALTANATSGYNLLNMLS